MANSSSFECSLSITNSLTGALYLLPLAPPTKGQWLTPPPASIAPGDCIACVLEPAEGATGCIGQLQFSVTAGGTTPDITLQFSCEKDHGNQVAFNYVDPQFAVLFTTPAPGTTPPALNTVSQQHPLAVDFVITYKITRVVNQGGCPLVLEDGSTFGPGATLWTPTLDVGDTGYSNYPAMFPVSQAGSTPFLTLTLNLDTDAAVMLTGSGSATDPTNPTNILSTTAGLPSTPGTYDIALSVVQGSQAGYFNGGIFWTLWTRDPKADHKSLPIPQPPIETPLELFLTYDEPGAMWNQGGVWVKTLRDVFGDMAEQKLPTQSVPQSVAIAAVVNSCFTGFSGKYLHYYGTDQLYSGNAINLALYYGMAGSYAQPSVGGNTDCVSQAGLCQSFLGALGIATVTLETGGFGFSSKGALVGRTTTNNPLYYSPASSWSGYPNHQPVCDEMDTGRSHFAIHFFLAWGWNQGNGQILDATVGPYAGTQDLPTYLALVQDKVGPYGLPLVPGVRPATPQSPVTASSVICDGVLIQSVGSSIPSGGLLDDTPPRGASGASPTVAVPRRVHLRWNTALVQAAHGATLSVSHSSLRHGHGVAQHTCLLSDAAGQRNMRVTVTLHSGHPDQAPAHYRQLLRERFDRRGLAPQPVPDLKVSHSAQAMAGHEEIVIEHHNVVLHLLGSPGLAQPFLARLLAQMDGHLVTDYPLPEAPTYRWSTTALRVGECMTVSSDAHLSGVVHHENPSCLRLVSRSAHQMQFKALRAGAAEIILSALDPDHLVTQDHRWTLSIAP